MEKIKYVKNPNNKMKEVECLLKEAVENNISFEILNNKLIIKKEEWSIKYEILLT